MTQPVDPAPLSVRHVWVDCEDGRVPGLLLRWEKSPAGAWRGWVTRPALVSGAWYLIEEWVAADHLKPVEPAR